MKEKEERKKPVDIHSARVKKIIDQGIESMEKGESAVFPISKIIEAETNRLTAEAKNNSVKNKSQKKP
jgi:hypothetical protein